MTIKEYVDDVLCVPVTRIGNKFIVEAIELVIDTHNHKFYDTLSKIENHRVRYLEVAIRSAKILGLEAMKATYKTDIFGENNPCPDNTTYIVRAAEYYRRNYENKET